MAEEKRIPGHVAVIMDGNGRWAKQRGMIRLQGHNAGMQSLKEIVKHCSVIGVKQLTVYAFSTENWKRPQDEVSGIFKLLVRYVAQEIKELNDNNVKVNIFGDVSRLPDDAQASVETALSTTAANSGLEFNIALNYGGRAEITGAVKSIAQDLKEGRLSREEITEELISSRLYTAGMPDPDLIIRTGGEYRLSNFLIWQSAYSELYITPVLWPDFTPQELDKAIDEFNKRDRRFGGIK